VDLRRSLSTNLKRRITEEHDAPPPSPNRLTRFLQLQASKQLKAIRER
jgi:hypothetical protein